MVMHVIPASCSERYRPFSTSTLTASVHSSRTPYLWEMARGEGGGRRKRWRKREEGGGRREGRGRGEDEEGGGRKRGEEEE